MTGKSSVLASMNEDSRAVRVAVIEQVQLLARASLQTQYETNVPIADVPAELICGFCDDLFHPKNQTFLDAFTESEMKQLAVLYGLLYLVTQKLNRSHPLKVMDLQQLPEWRTVMAYAKELDSGLKCVAG